MNDDQTAAVFKAIGSLTASVDAMREDINQADALARENRKAVYEKVNDVSNRVTRIGADVEAVQKTVTNDVLPTVQKVKLWEQRGIGFMAAIGLAGTTAGALLSQYWSDIVKLLFAKG